MSEGKYIFGFSNLNDSIPRVANMKFARLRDLNDEPEREFGDELKALLRARLGEMFSPSKLDCLVEEIENLRSKYM